MYQVSDQDSGNKLASTFLKRVCGKQTLLLVSGGTSPNYSDLIVHNRLRFGSLALVDERFGQPFHENSNELLLKKAGVFDFCDRGNIGYSRILKGKEIKSTTEEYASQIQNLFRSFRNKVAIMGVGSDTHTAGIAPNRNDWKNPIFNRSNLVDYFDDKNGPFGSRVTLTFKALKEVSFFIVLMFGESKNEALKKIVGNLETSLEKYPGVFYRLSDIPTVIITDLTI